MVRIEYLAAAAVMGICLLPAHAEKENAQEMKDFLKQLTPEAAALLGDPAQLKPDGHEIAQKLLSQIKVQNIDRATLQEAYEKNKTRVAELMSNKVNLLGGYETQDLGNPIDWYRAPRDDWQWPTHLSRHYWLKPVAEAYVATGDPAFGNKVVDTLVSWVQETPIGHPKLNWRNSKSIGKDFPETPEGYFKAYPDGPWTSLSAQIRVDTWSCLLQCVADAPHMNNKNAAILLGSIQRDHRLSMINHSREEVGNQYLSIARSLISLEQAYPFLAGGKEAAKIGWERVTDFAKRYVYEDGSFSECAANYTTRSLRELADLARETRAHGGTVPDLLLQRIRAGMRYFAMISDPLGNASRIAKGGGSLRTLLLDLEKEFPDPEVRYLATGGKEGKEPQAKSVCFPWAGHVVFRSDWSERAVWMFFEPGPRGSGHADNAQLGIQLIANQRWLLTDPGYFTYSFAGRDGEIASYLHSSLAHNTGIVDGKGQMSQGRSCNTAPGDYGFCTGKTVAAQGEYTRGFGEKGEIKVKHARRIVFYPAERTFEIEDVFSGEGEHKVAVHWQIHPDAEARIENGLVRVVNGGTTLTIDSQSSAKVELAAIRGQEKPWLGWYSETYGKLTQATTITTSVKAKLPVTIKTRLHIED